MNDLKKRQITLVLTCESESFLPEEWFKIDLMQEIGCCTELYELESIKVEEVSEDAAGK